MKCSPDRRLTLAAILLFACALSLAAQPAPGKKVLTLADYPRWQQITASAISPDAGWFAYVLKPNGGDETLHIKNLSVEKVFEIPGGTRPVFSRDSKWAAYSINPPKADAEKLRKEKKPVPRKIELLNLLTGAKFSVDNAASFVFSNDSLCFAVKKTGAPAQGDSPGGSQGADLLVRNLRTGEDLMLGNVGRFAFNKPGRFLAYTVAVAENKGNGLYLFEPAAGKMSVLDSADVEYTALAWDRNGSALAVLKGTKNKDAKEKDNTLLAFTGIGKTTPSAGPLRVEYEPAKDTAFPRGMVLSERSLPERRFGPPGDEPSEDSPLTWSEDLSRIFCGVKEQEREPEKSDEPVADVDVWHWKDERIQSQQMVEAEDDRNFTYRSVFLVGTKKFIRLADEKMRSVTTERDGRWAVGRDNKPYLSDVESQKADYYALDTSTGGRTLIVSGILHELGLSPDGRHFLYLKDKQLWLYTFAAAKTSNISEKAGVIFADEEDDHPDEQPPFGAAGWTADGKAVIMNHKYDLWLLPLDGGTPRNITAGTGTKEEIRFRVVRLDPEERAIDPAKPLLLSAYGEWTKKAGFYSLKIGAPPVKLVFEDKLFGRPVKARSADRLVYTIESFVDYPDYYVSGKDFAAPKRITEAAAQQAEYAWGTRTLLDFQNSKGKKLQAALTLPAGYEKGKRYPMLVYIYEKMSQQLHRYSLPTYDDRPHMSAYASDGYLVLMPDIAYEIGKPGSSALDCAAAAVNKAVELGYADPKRIGLQGHSYGGLETAFIITQTDLFACAVAGAAPSSVAIEFNQVFKGSGENNHFYYERNQGRMGTTPWKDPALYDSQSAIRQAENITTPFLLLHGTVDGSVDWMESLEYYNAARRLGKEVIFLSYPGEDHHLAREENAKDFQARMKQYFDHYLKGVPAPEWMTKGVPFLKKGSAQRPSRPMFPPRDPKAEALRGAYGPFRANNDLLSYDLDIRIDPAAKSWGGKNTIRFKMLKEDARIQLDLSAGLKIEKITFEGAELKYAREYDAVFVDFPRPLKKDETAAVDFCFSGQSTGERRWGGISFAADPAGRPWITTACQGAGAMTWWPNKEQQRDEVENMRLRVAIPNGLTDVSNGRFAGKTDLGDGYTRWDWEIHYPINNYCVSVNIGNYVHFDDRLGELTMDFYCLPENLDKAKKQFAQAKPMIECFQKYFGPYPFPEDGYKLIEVPYSGMEHQSAVTYGNRFANGYLERDWTGVGTSLKFDFIIIHESAHEWLGNSITAADVCDEWIHEGWGTYMEAVYVEHMFGKDEAIQYINGYQSKVKNELPVVGEPGINYYGSQDIYFKGALFINTLRSIVDDDAKWWNLVRGFYDRFKYRNIATEDVAAFFEKESGLNLRPVFEQYLRHAALPALETAFDEASGEISYRWKAEVKEFAMPVKVGKKGGEKRLLLRPTTEWQKMKSDIKKDEFAIAGDLYYIDVIIG